MKQIVKYASATALLIGLWSCQSQDPYIDEAQELRGDFYATVTLDLPVGTRSVTDDWDDGGNSNSNNGFEIGQSDENAINDVFIVMATEAGGKYTKVASNKNSTNATTPDGSPTFMLEFTVNELTNSANKQVYLFAYCNLSEEKKTEIDNASGEGNFTNIIGTIAADAEESISKSGNFLMTNAPSSNAGSVNLPSQTIPSETELKNGTYGTPQKAFNLGTIKVARVSARFDFRQTTIEGQDRPNVYPIYTPNMDRIEENRVADVEVLAMAPINIAKEFYLLPRVSDDGKNATRSLCGTETPSNYVVSPNDDKKTASKLDNTFLGKYLYQANSNNTADGKNYSDINYYKYTNLSEFDSRKDDDDENWTAPEGGSKAGYKIWRYVTENTFPKSEDPSNISRNQKKGITTGVVFKAEIKNPKEGSKLAIAMGKGRNIYQYNGIIYGDVYDLRDFVATLSPSDKLRQKFVSMCASGNITEEQLFEKNAEEDYVLNGEGTNIIPETITNYNDNFFKIFRATHVNSQYHYYVYYPYYNRHNNNNDPGVMGAMEFATVRNNIYKLSITNITLFGHTDNPKDDPDPEDPDDPDEELKVYFKVSVSVVPWVVRVNEIEF